MCFAIPPRRPPIFMRRQLNRQRHRLMMVSCVLDLLDEEQQRNLRGRLYGTKNVRRTRKKVDSMWSELGSYARKAYRMRKQSFELLHEILEPKLKEEFNSGERARGTDPNGPIPTQLRLSAALRFFAGASIYDIMLTHGIGKQSVYDSVYGVVNVVNEEPSLGFNANNGEFPSHDEQREIAAGFKLKSGADFDKIMLTMDGMLIWTTQPTKADCKYLNIGQRLFHCYRKDKFGWLLMAGCDHDTKFRWADIRHPSSTSDYLTWVSSDLGWALEKDDSDIILDGHTLAGDNAFVENETMSTPIPGLGLSTLEDAYNFYFCQIRITIERAFGILVHRWALLRRPMSISTLKVPALVMCLMRLHNFCIDHDSRKTPGTIYEDERNIQIQACRERGPKRSQRGIPSAVTLDKNGRPEALLGSGHHFQDETWR